MHSAKYFFHIHFPNMSLFIIGTKNKKANVSIIKICFMISRFVYKTFVKNLNIGDFVICTSSHVANIRIIELVGKLFFAFNKYNYKQKFKQDIHLKALRACKQIKIIVYVIIFRLLPQVGKAEENMEEYFGLGFCGNMQHKLWNLVENPNSSFAAKVYFHFYPNFIL